MLTFADAGLGWALLPLFVVWVAIWVLVPKWRRRTDRSSALRFSSISRFRSLSSTRKATLRRLVQALRLVTVALLLLAMARPQTGRTLTQVQTEGVDIMLVLDASGSMQGLDLDADRSMKQRRNRLEVARDVVEEFVKKRPNDQVGLVVFGDQAFTQCPLTLDHGVLLGLLDRVEIGMAGATRTAVGSALGTAVKRLRDSQAKSKIVVLLTDGRSNAGSLTPLKAAAIAETFDVKVYTIGAGTRGKAPFLTDSTFGQRVFYQDVEIDEETLQAIADRTGGLYFRAEDLRGLEQVYDEIDRLEKTEITMNSYMEFDERFSAFVAPAVLLLLLEVVLLGTGLRRLP